MKLSKEEINLINQLGYDDMPEDKDKQFELYEKIEDILLNKGITNSEVNEIGIICESLLDKLEG